MNGPRRGRFTSRAGLDRQRNWDTSGADDVHKRQACPVRCGQDHPDQDSSNLHNLTISGTVTESNATDVGGNLSISGTLTTFWGNDITGGASLTVRDRWVADGRRNTITIRSMDTSAGPFHGGGSTIVVTRR